MKRITILVFLIFILFDAVQLKAQRFESYFIFGANITDASLTKFGDSQVGTRLGLNIGPGVTLNINEKWETNMEMLFSQNGGYVEFVQVPNIGLNKIRLNYIEMPFTIDYRFNIKKNDKEQFYKQRISCGITFAQLFKYKIIAIDGFEVTDDIRFDKERALLFNFGATSFFSESIALKGKGTLSIFGEWTFSLRLLHYFNKG